MYYKPLFVLSFVLFATVCARSVRDVSTNAEAPTVLSLFELINENFKKFGNTVSQSFNAQAFEETGRDVAKQLDEWGANIKKETESLKDNEAVKSFRATVDKVLDEIKQSPDAKAVIEKYNSETEVLKTEFEKFQKTQEPKLKELAQKILEQTTTSLQDIKKVFEKDVKQ
ncbi:uncharacterized protein LOC129239346 [Anastrepha obliqua]|uniref:uncharacterized protein LOC129239346 n=1 Tax=Anastrepha obliqua TaxID=95512 RepID=UPI00240A2945|nr:uncharacterized protein LOC129239346 [Anastrepha obliqua]